MSDSATPVAFETASAVRFEERPSSSGFHAAKGSPRTSFTSSGRCSSSASASASATMAVSSRFASVASRRS
jgi:hypothetical protein